MVVGLRTASFAAFLAVSSAVAIAQTPRKPAPEAEVCKNCHADYVESYFATKHGQSGNQRGPDCSTCHVNAEAHAAAGGGKGAGGILG